MQVSLPHCPLMLTLAVKTAKFIPLLSPVPFSKEPLRFQVGEKVYRPLEETHAGASSTLCPSPVARRTKGFWFCDLLPA